MNIQKAIIVEYSYAGRRKAYFHPDNKEKFERFKKNYGHKFISITEGYCPKGKFLN